MTTRRNLEKFLKPEVVMGIMGGVIATITRKDLNARVKYPEIYSALTLGSKIAIYYQGEVADYSNLTIPMPEDVAMPGDAVAFVEGTPEYGTHCLWCVHDMSIYGYKLLFDPTSGALLSIDEYGQIFYSKKYAFY